MPQRPSDATPDEIVSKAAAASRIPVQLFGLATLAAAFACGDPYRHTNAYDPAVSDNMSGASGHTATFMSVGPPQWPAAAVKTISVMVGGIDTLPTVAIMGPVVPITLYRHTASRTVVITQRFTHIRLRCPDVHACDTLSAGASWTVWADPLDALNQRPYALNPPVPDGPPEASFTVRDTTVARATTGTRASTVTALKSGSTWIVATRDSLLDSLRLVVR